jgi:hypothetical protein
VGAQASDQRPSGFWLINEVATSESVPAARSFAAVLIPYHLGLVTGDFETQKKKNTINL